MLNFCKMLEKYKNYDIILKRYKKCCLDSGFWFIREMVINVVAFNSYGDASNPKA